MKIYIVVFEEYAHGSKILEDSKVFLDKSQAQQFCDSLNAEPSDWWEDNEIYFIKEMRDAVFIHTLSFLLYFFQELARLIRYIKYIR
ncbi:MAG: hypothetical protein ACTHKP_03735 [Nitrososphaeraceae archaeon]